jgi:hypothetical protein
VRRATALLRIPFGSACRNDPLEKRYFPNFDGVLVKRGFAATGVAAGLVD